MQAPPREPRQMISVDSHVFFTDEWSPHAAERLKPKWLDATDVSRPRKPKSGGMAARHQ